MQMLIGQQLAQHDDEEARVLTVRVLAAVQSELVSDEPLLAFSRGWLAEVGRVWVSSLNNQFHLIVIHDDSASVIGHEIEMQMPPESAYC